ncbi:MAG TPA: acyl-CoA dehydrogenase family protein [Acidimicrobiales bacterium]|nr:acyl-CoA dehydrogenase family protein [Acidimicrobiales bacterium]
MTLADQQTSLTPQGVLDAARALGPTIADRAREIEAARRVPVDLLDQLIDAGCFRILLPTTHHGVGADLPAAMRVFESLAHADASVGWTVMIGAGAWCDLAGLSRAAFDALFDGDHDTIVAGAFNPTGSIEAVDGAYRVTGRWSFASGCQHATWIFGNCVEGIVDGVPRLRGVVFSREQVTIEDTWNVSGLAGTGSHHFNVDGVVVPAERTFKPLADEPCLDAPIVRIPPPAAFSLAIASVALGIAQGALDDIVALARAKVPLLAHAPLAANAQFHFELANADTTLRAARALIYETATATWAGAVDGTPLTLEERARIRAAGVWAVEQAAAVVTTAYRAGGGTSLYADCPLQRRLRDINAVTQHFLVKRDTLSTAGAILAGQDVEVMVF